MTTEDKRNQMIKRGRIILDPWDALAHYLLIYVMGAFNLFILVFVWDQAPRNPTGATMTNSDIIVWTGIDAFLMTAFYFVQRERLKLKKETIDLEPQQILSVIQEVGEKYEWSVDVLEKDFIQADSIRLLATDNRITIFIRNKDVYVNCRTMHGDIPGIFRGDKMAETFLSELRMKSYEIQHQKAQMEKQASR